MSRVESISQNMYFDAEAELTSMLSEYISLEIDLEILDMLKANALTLFMFQKFF